MAFREFDIAQLFESVFGYKPRPYQLDNNQVSVPGTWKDGSIDKNKLFAYPADQEPLGGESPYYDNYKDMFGSDSGKKIFLPAWINGWMLPYPVIAIQSRKNIMETVMIDRQGTVKELVNTEDYKISIKGIIVREDGTYPEYEIKQLKEIFEINQTVELKSVLTDFFLLNPNGNGSSLSQVVITDLNFPHTVGVKNAKAYEMSLVSDNAYTLYV
ncbi:MAG: hypothetical protein EPN37_04530 [Chitinophagaceae bacterium]|nr:MAG: hypothetical protein EPN37_04530 [Chitinophagaceae bacterium]